MTINIGWLLTKMNRRHFISSALSLFFSSTVSSQQNRGQQTLVLGVFPRRNVKTTYKIFTPLVQALSQHLGINVKLVSAKNFHDFWSGVQNREYDIVHFNQYHYVVAYELYAYDVILKNLEFGESTIAGSVAVRKDQDIDSIDDLRGKHIIFGGGYRAMMSYIAVTWLLRQGGLGPDDYKESFARNPPNALITAYHKRADAAGAGDMAIRLDVVKKNIDVSEMKYLARTESLTHLPWAVKRELDPMLKDKIASFLDGLKDDPAGQKILDAAKLSGLLVASDKEYNEHRELIKKVYGEDYGISRFEK